MHGNKLSQAVIDIFFLFFTTCTTVKELQKYIPDITSSDIRRGPAGVRAQAMNIQGELIGDFIFDSPPAQQNEVLANRVLHCRNAPSPGKCTPKKYKAFTSKTFPKLLLLHHFAGATSSLAIARMMAKKMEEVFDLPARPTAKLY